MLAGSAGHCSLKLFSSWFSCIFDYCHDESLVSDCQMFLFGSFIKVASGMAGGYCYSTLSLSGCPFALPWHMLISDWLTHKDFIKWAQCIQTSLTLNHRIAKYFYVNWNIRNEVRTCFIMKIYGYYGILWCQTMYYTINCVTNWDEYSIIYGRLGSVDGTFIMSPCSCQLLFIGRGQLHWCLCVTPNAWASWILGWPLW